MHIAYRNSDLPERSLGTETVQFNGKYGCIKYYQEGKGFKLQKGAMFGYTCML